MTSPTVVILDCFTVEPSGLGVPPYLSTYVREAYSALRRAFPDADVHYLTIDDVRWHLNGGRPHVEAPASDPLTYAATANRESAVQLLHDAERVVVIGGDKVPSVHLHAVNGSLPEIARALAGTRGRTALLGPMSAYAVAEPEQFAGLFDTIHSHTLTSATVDSSTFAAAGYAALRADRDSYAGLVEQLSWEPIAEIELYRGCTRRRFCGFCAEPVKATQVVFRDVDDVVHEISLLAAAGVRHFRLGMQTCFFSYQMRDETQIEALLAGIRAAVPDIAVLHIDNADPLVVASRTGARIAKLVARYCTEGNCAPMGVESFDPVVVERNALTCTGEIALRAVENVNAAGAERGPGGLPLLLPGLNLIYGLPGESHGTHLANLTWLGRILEAGLLCHRTNVRLARVYPGTPLARLGEREPAPAVEHFQSWKAELDAVWDLPMKERVYPVGLAVPGLHAFFVDEAGTWFRRLGSYSIQIVEPGAAVPRYTAADLRVTGHASRWVYGQRHGS